MLAADCCQELEDELGGLGLPCPALSADDHTLVPLATLHEVVGIVRNGKDVRRLFPKLLVFVPVDVSLVVNGKELVRVDGHKDGPSEGLGEGRMREGGEVWQTSSCNSFKYLHDIKIGSPNDLIFEDNGNR